MRSFIVVVFSVCMIGPAPAQQHIWGKFGTPRPRPSAPVLFLDKPAHVVDFQLKRLDNQRLLKAHRNDNDAKFVPVFREIVSRPGLDAQAQSDAVAALVRLEKSSRVEVLLDAIGSMPKNADSTTRSLAKMLVATPVEDLESEIDRLKNAAASKNRAIARAAFAGLIQSGMNQDAISIARGAGKNVLLDAVTLVSSEDQRSAMKDYVVAAVEQDKNIGLRVAGTQAIAKVQMDATEKFDLVAPLVFDERSRPAAVNTMLAVPAKSRGKSSAMAVLSELVLFAERTPKAKRTSDTFLAAMSLADQLLAVPPSAEAKAYRARLEAVTVRLIRIATVEEEMRYDTPHFVVAAGKPVQIVLINHDVMPHNLVIGVPGSLKQVAADGLATGPTGGWKGLPYVPKSNDVLQATKMVASDQQDRITFDAPTEPGEYPYVCTFPQHWYRMYGVMVVVEDLDAYLKAPFEPTNPLGNTRSFVAKWTVDDLKNELVEGMKGRSASVGAKLFTEASCEGCHVMNGKGGKIGPDLTDLYARWKGDDIGILRELLEPSHKIDAKYAMQKILTFDGQTITGILVDEDDHSVRLVRSAEDKQPIEVLQDDIDVMVPSSVSIMPKALMDLYTRDEIFELMAYLKNAGK